MKILIIRFSSLGDIILTEPVIRNLHEHYGSAEIHYLTKEIFSPIVKRFEYIDKIWLWKDKKKLIGEMRRENFDLVIDLHKKFNSFLVTIFLSTKTITYDKKRILRTLIVKKLTRESIDSVVDLYLRTLRKAKIDYKRYAPKLISKQTLATTKFLADYEIPTKKNLIGIFPGATHSTKQYPPDCLASFINSVPDSWLCHFIILGNYKEKPLSVRICSKIKKHNFTDMTGLFSISELIDFMNNLDGFITNDSGPMHIAAALQKPQIAIYGATHPRLGFRPLNKKAIILKSDVKCQPCSLHGGKSCPQKHFNCMRSITPDYLLKWFKTLLEDNILKIN